MLLPLLQNNLLSSTDIDVNVSTATLQLATYAATVSVDIDVSVSTATLSLQTYQATVTATDLAIEYHIIEFTSSSYSIDFSATSYSITIEP